MLHLVQKRPTVPTWGVDVLQVQFFRNVGEGFCDFSFVSAVNKLSTAGREAPHKTDIQGIGSMCFKLFFLKVGRK